MRVASLRLDLPEANLTTLAAVAVLIGTGVAIALLPLTLSGAVLLGAIVLVLTLVRPEFGIYLAVFSVPFGSIRQVDLGMAALTATELIVPLVFASWILRFVARREKKVIFGPIFPFAVLFFGVLVFSTTVSLSVPMSVKELLKWAEFLLLYFVVVNVVTTRRQIAMVVAVIILATSIEALHGWYQFFLRQGPDGFLIGGRFLRAFGTFGQPNPYAGYLGLTLPLVIGLLIGAKWDLSLRVDWGFIALVASLVVITAAMAMSLSRGAWMGLSVAIAFMLAVRSRKSLILLLAAVVIVAAVAFLGALALLPKEVTDRLSIVTEYFGVFDVRSVALTPENWAIVERMAYWQTAWNMFTDHLAFGVGIGNFRAFYPDYAFPDWLYGASDHAHNYYLNLLAETGISGLAAYIVFLLAIFLFAWKVIRQLRVSDADSPRGWEWFSQPYPLALGITGTFLAISVHNFFDVLYVHSMAAQVGLVLGLLAATYYSRTSEGG